MPKKLINWAPAIFLMCVILLLSSSGSGQSLRSVGISHEPFYVSGHFFFFSLLCFAYYKATKKIAISLVLTVLFGLVDELFQLTQRFRSASASDLFVDFLAGLAAALILWKLQAIIPKILKDWLNS